MANLWLTYSWADNANQDIDYIAQELVQAGLTVHLDRWDLEAGKRLWEQIGDFINDPNRTDAWMIYATDHSLGSERCKEELYYAVERALASRGDAFPVAALFPSAGAIDLLPRALKVRLNIALEDTHWTERVAAMAEGRLPSIDRPEVGPYCISFHRSSSRHFVEIRPRAGVISRFFAAIPASEKDTLDPSVVPGPFGLIPSASCIMGPREFYREADGRRWWVMTARNQATPSRSYFLQCREIPSKILFGELNGQCYRGRAPASERISTRILTVHPHRSVRSWIPPRMSKEQGDCSWITGSFSRFL